MDQPQLLAAIYSMAVTTSKDVTTIRKQNESFQEHTNKRFQEQGTALNSLTERMDKFELDGGAAGLSQAALKHLGNVQKGVTNLLRKQTAHVLVVSNWQNDPTASKKVTEKSREKKLSEVAAACSGVTIKSFDHPTDKDGKLTPYSKINMASADHAHKLMKYCIAKKLANAGADSKPLYVRIDTSVEIRQIQKPLTDMSIELRRKLKGENLKISVNLKGNALFAGGVKVAEQNGLGKLEHVYEGDNNQLATILDHIAIN